MSSFNKEIIFNLISNYGLLILRIVLSLALVRVMFLGISQEEYGFWALLWTIFGYSLLLDFGFGTAIQKATSEASEDKNWDYFNRVLSTVFFTYVVLSSVIVVATLLITLNLDSIFNFSKDSSIEYYQTTMLIFGLGSAIVFPFGFFTEILRGIQEIRLRNLIVAIYLVVNFILIYSAIKLDYSLIELALITIIVQLLQNLTMAVFSYKKIKVISISFKYFTKEMLKDVMSFSLFAYIVTFSNIIIFRTDQMVIAMFGTVAFAAFYQVSSRLAEMFRQFSSQFYDNLNPIASVLFVSGKSDELSNMLLHSTRLVGFISTLLLIPAVIYAAPILKIWLEIDDILVSYVAIILLFAMYSQVFLRDSVEHILLMANRHKELTIISSIEAVANLILSIILIRYYGILGVALGTLIPNVTLAIIYNIPTACKFTNLSFKEFFNETLKGNLISGILASFLAYILYVIFIPESFLMIFLSVILTIICYLFIYYIFGLKSNEKDIIKNYIKVKNF